MANVATMGPPPSPKEPRRSGRRSLPAPSASKSPAGSPTSESGPKPKDNNNRPPPPATNGSNRNKRSKQEDHEDSPEDIQKNGVHGATNGRAKRKGKEKEKEKAPLTVDIPTDGDPSNVENPGGDVPPEVHEDDEEAGVTRCICEGTPAEEDAGGWMAMCEECHTWQHGLCMGYDDVNTCPVEYFCERCRPDLHPDLLKKHKRTRQPSTASHHTTTTAANPSRSSRSHSPTHLLKPTKRRNTMNSRDAAYDESLIAVLEATAAEAAANEAVQHTQVEMGEDNTNGLAETEQEAEAGGRKKRKRTDDDAVSAKRTRSASVASDPPLANPTPRDPTPVVNEITKAASPLPPPPPPAAKPRTKRGGGRKSQAHDLMSVDGEEGTPSSTRRQGGGRSKVNAIHEHGTRRNANGVNGHGPSSSSHPNSAASRAYHSSHAYALTQQPLFTSWNLPDYLSHLSSILPTDVPHPLEVRGFSVGANGQESLERTTERGVKIKWPSKRMSVGDMNKRVRALVEWVGREQASAAERGRRKEAVEKALMEAQPSSGDSSTPTEQESGENSSDVPMVLDGGTLTQSPVQEKRISLLNSLCSPDAPENGISTMKMMEELMEELISFQERFGPGAKSKDRERRTVTS